MLRDGLLATGTEDKHIFSPPGKSRNQKQRVLLQKELRSQSHVDGSCSRLLQTHLGKVLKTQQRVWQRHFNTLESDVATTNPKRAGPCRKVSSQEGWRPHRTLKSSALSGLLHLREPARPPRGSLQCYRGEGHTCKAQSWVSF